MDSGEVGEWKIESRNSKTTTAFPTTNYQQFIFHPTRTEAEALNPSMLPQIKAACR